MPKPKIQGKLFDEPAEWEKEWQDMPEFVQKDLTPYKSIKVHFETQADMLEFAKLVGQNIHYTTQSVWYPKADIGKFADKRYADES